MDYYNQDFHQDHLHPAATFYLPDRLVAAIPEEDREFAADSKNWNSVANLQLLNGLLNESKSDMPLKEWVEKNGIDKKTLFIDETTSLDVRDFKAFITERRKGLIAYLKKTIGRN